MRGRTARSSTRRTSCGVVRPKLRAGPQVIGEMLLHCAPLSEAKLHRETIDVRDTVQTAIRVVEAQARERGVIIQTSMP